jgi:LuxR family transcriptional regulator, maltose regulon positive regulatory protein
VDSTLAPAVHDSIGSGKASGTPRLPRGLVPRPRLVEQLHRAVFDSRITLISAPPGTGKTVLLSSWLDQLGDQLKRVAWLGGSVDPDTSTFWPRAEAAVGAVVGGSAAPDELPVATISRLVEGSDGPVVLAVDDFGEFATTAVLEPLKALLRHGPANLHIAVACRRDPDLALYRFRLDGDLAEIRALDLAFTEAEATSLFDAAGVEIEPSQVRTLVDRTEGWAAGLRFAALSLRERDRVEPFVNAFARTERAISEYLVREVLSGQGDERRVFLLRTSICDRMTAELADAVTGRSDGEATLAALEHDNVFIESGPDPGWYRYHPLFRELLRTQARYELAGDLVDVHRSAARWLAANGDGLAALRHAFAAQDGSLAGRLLAETWVQLMGRGESSVAAELLTQLPNPSIRAEPHLCLLTAWHRFSSGESAEATAWLSLADRAAEPLDVDARQQYDTDRSLVTLLRARRTGDGDDLERTIADLAQPEALMQSPRGGEYRRTVAACARGAVATWRGELDKGTAALETALDASRRLGLRDCELDALSLLALTYAVRGELKRADRVARLTVEACDQEPQASGRSAHRATALAARALCAFEWDDLDSTQRHGAAAREAADAVGDRLARLATALAGASSFHRLGFENVERARLELAGISADLAADVSPPLLLPRLLALRSRIALAEGDLGAAKSILAKHPAPHPAELIVAAARVDLARRDTAAAARALGAVAAGVVPAMFARTRVEGAVLRAVAAAQVGDGKAGCEWIERALDLAEPEGMRAPFFEGGVVVQRLLRDAIRQGTGHRWLAGALVAAFDDPAGEGGAAELLEPLSEKECIVLRYLPTMMSNQEIAGELFVSVNTIKTHLKNIYRKLGSSDRRQAVRRARQLRLIS